MKEKERFCNIITLKSSLFAEQKTIRGFYFSKKLLEKARNHRLNLSRITEPALSSILDYMETQNIQKSSGFSLSTLSLFPKEKVLVDGTGFEPVASTMPTWRSYQADLPAQRTSLL